MLEVRNLQIKYGEKKIISNLDFDVHSGDIVGILGKNGVGKTTILKAIVGMKDYSGGTVKFDEEDTIGYLPETAEIYDYLTAYEFLTALGKMKNITDTGIKEIEDWISDYIELPDLNVLISMLSKGSLEKVIFFQALFGFPNILVLDEPFTGFDAKSFIGAKQLLKDYAKMNKMIILSTHIVEMCAQLCNKVVMINSENQFEQIHLAEEMQLEKKIILLENKIIKTNN